MPRHARVTRGPHTSCHVASEPRRNGAMDPRATSARRRVSSSTRQLRRYVFIFFAIFLTKKYLKIQLKII